MAVVLLITTNEQEFELPILGKCIVGRSARSDLKLDDKQMSGKHGMFELNGKGELIYTDLDSTNGSYLNNSQIQKIQFKISETLRLGNTMITIDEKKLNPKERLAIGRGQPEDNGNETLVIPRGTKSRQFVKEKHEESQQKKSLLLNKDHKKKIAKENWISGKNKNLIEQEKSSGLTKMLKLDINKAKKK
ncbi:MAG: FHA domain-containing protein [Bacteriovorax sp.]|nr:FHA domain-containing protein [Bacteriovorax sp.]